MRLTPIEYRLLGTLASRPGYIYSRPALALQAWGHQDIGSSRAIDAHIARLRIKLRAGPGPVPQIVTVRRFGYMFVPVASGPTPIRNWG
jgi:two-component system response regulator MtrA